MLKAKKAIVLPKASATARVLTEISARQRWEAKWARHVQNECELYSSQQQLLRQLESGKTAETYH